jgi:MucB/RseB N-terminal domain
MSHPRFAILGLVLAVGIAGCGISDDESRAILDRAEKAGRELGYRGIVVRRFMLDGRERSTTVRVHHGAEGTRYEATLPGSSRTWTRFSTEEPGIHWLRDRDLLFASYRVVEEGEDLVAGRPALRYRLQARMPDRPCRRFWLDRETSLLLRDEGLDADGHVIEAKHFELIEYGVPAPIPDLEGDEAPPAARGSSLRPIEGDDLAAAVGFEPYWPRSLPEGFRLLRCHVREGERSGAVIVYGDGLAQFVISEWPDAGAGTTDEEVEVRRKTRPGETWLGLRLNGTRIDVSSRTIGSTLLLEIVASLSRGGEA